MLSETLIKNKYILALSSALLLASVFFFTKLGYFPLFNPDEALYAEPAYEMLKTNEYITTQLNYAVRYTKPPLVIWTMALSYKIFGVNEFASRFVTALCALLTVVLMVSFVFQNIDFKTSLISAAILLLSPLFLILARESITDMPLTFMIFASILNIFDGIKQNKTPYLGFIFIGLSIMTKGPIGLIIPLLVLTPYLIVTKTNSKIFNYKNFLIGIFIICIIALPWYIIEIGVTHWKYFEEFILRENFQRFTGVVDSHKGNPFYHIFVILLGFLPWSIFLPNIIKKIVVDFAIDFKNPKSFFSNISDSLIKNSDLKIILLSIIACISIVGFFSFSKSKLIPYTLPAFPFAAIIYGYYLPKIYKEKLTINYFILLIVSSTAYYILPNYFYKLRDTTTDINNLILNFITFTALTSSVLIIFSVLKFYKVAFSFFVTYSLIAILGYGSYAYNLLSQTWELPIKKIGLYLKNKTEPIILYDIRKPSIIFYADRKTLIPHNDQEFENCIKLNKCAYIATKLKDNQKMKSIQNCKLVFNDGLFSLYYYARLK